MAIRARPLVRAIRGLLAAGVVALGGAGVAWGNSPAVDEATVGTRIAGGGVRSPAPAVVYDRAALEASGAISVAEFLRGVPWNSFGSERPHAGTPGQGFAGLALHGLGEARTLVLLDGRRLATDPVRGEGQDLSEVPLAAIERIEVLADGASAVYGSAAVGGVVNLVSRRGFQGAELSLGLGVPDRAGGETESGSALLGAAGSRGSLLAGAAYANRRIGTVELDAGLRSSEVRHYTLFRNVVVPRLAQPFISDGRYDIYAPFATDPAVLGAMRATLNDDALSSLEEAYATASTSLWPMQGGAAQLAVGAEYRREAHAFVPDPLQRTQQLAGGSGRSSAAEATARAAFLELLLPLRERLDVSLALRHDHSWHGGELSSRLALAYRPVDALRLHASLGESFVAPSLATQGLAPVGSLEPVIDGAGCLPGIPCEPFLVPVFDIANPGLQAEQVRHMRVGLSWDAGPAWTLQGDVWAVRIDDRIRQAGSALLVACLGGAVACPPGVSALPALPPPQPQAGLGVARDPRTGFVAYVQRGLANAGELAAQGVDLQLQHRRTLGGWGLLEQSLTVGWMDSFRLAAGSGGLWLQHPPLRRLRPGAIPALHAILLIHC